MEIHITNSECMKKATGKKNIFILKYNDDMKENMRKQNLDVLDIRHLNSYIQANDEWLQAVQMSESF